MLRKWGPGERQQGGDRADAERASFAFAGLPLVCLNKAPECVGGSAQGRIFLDRIGRKGWIIGLW
ncbi:MAG TPA: hypothetical protein GX503_05140 [Clostridiales bacterium]|nr:hypothetical protein [Clostridiales bacterium]